MNNVTENATSFEKDLKELLSNTLQQTPQSGQKEIRERLSISLLKTIDSLIKGEPRSLDQRLMQQAMSEEQEQFDPREKLELLSVLKSLINACSKMARLGARSPFSAEWRDLWNYVERIGRKIQLRWPDSQEEFEATLMWMIEKGDKEDLVRIKLFQVIKSDLPFTSEQIERFIDIAIQRIEQREIDFSSAPPQAYNTGGPSDFITQRLPVEPTTLTEAATYRVFCPEDARDFPQSVRVLQQYEAFAIVSAPPDAVSELRKRCPVEILEDEDDLKAAPVRPGETVMRNMVVRFIAPICDEWKKQIEDAGARIIQPLDNFSIIISLYSAQTLELIGRLNEVRDVYAFEPDIRIESLQGLGQDSTEEEATESRLAAAEGKAAYSDLRGKAIPGLLIASFFTREYRDRAAEELLARGIEVVSRPGEKRLIVDISSTKNVLNDFSIISRLEGLRVLEEKTIETWSNDVARKVLIEGSITTNPNPSGSVGLDCPDIDLTGKGEIIAVADTGLDTGDKSTLHLDFRGRVRFLEKYPIAESYKERVDNPAGDNNPADLSGHGTHVAGSAIGNGAQAQALKLPSIQGTAPDADLIFQAVEQTPKWNENGHRYYWQRYQSPPPERGFFGIPDELGKLFEEAYENGARIHCNSWGGGKIGDYNNRCEDLDEFVWNHKDFLVIVAAGNRGRQYPYRPDFIDQPSIDPPGTAKNCLTVGASENERKDFKYTYGMYSEKNFTAEPFYSRVMTDSIKHIVAFSSRGPCNDPDNAPRRRRKPDVVAPGTFILSPRSSQVSDDKLSFPWVQYSQAQSNYIYCSGTSMSAPLVAGCAALVRQYLREKKKITNPTAALLKASLIHSAEYLNDPNLHPSSSKWADNEQGWGRVNLKNIIASGAPTRTFFIDELQGLATGEERTYQFEINKSADESDNPSLLRVTLVYTDFPDEKLVNNLNLFLFSPEKKYYMGNYFEDNDETDSISNSEDERMPEPDSMNNVEGIVVRKPVAGVWTLKVVGSLVKHDRQDFALVISGDVQMLE